MADLFAAIASEVPAIGHHGDWSWRPLFDQWPARLEVRHQGFRIAILEGPECYDYLVRLMVAEPPRSE